MADAIKSNWKAAFSRQELIDWLVRRCQGRVLDDDGKPLGETELRAVITEAEKEAAEVKSSRQ